MVAASQALTPEILLRAYGSGIFPMAQSWDDPHWSWIDPEWRGILPLDGFHLPRSLAKRIRALPFEVRVDSDFRGVMMACAKPAPDRPNTWINPRIVEAYVGLHARGHAHSVECWRDGQMVGGLYGVRLGGAFFGESMFSIETDASKVALVYLVARLKAGGFILLDTQFVTDHLARFGATEVTRPEYHHLLDRACQTQADFYRLGPVDGLAGAARVLQLVTQTS